MRSFSSQRTHLQKHTQAVSCDSSAALIHYASPTLGRRTVGGSCTKSLTKRSACIRPPFSTLLPDQWVSKCCPWGLSRARATRQPASWALVTPCRMAKECGYEYLSPASRKIMPARACSGSKNQQALLGPRRGSKRSFSGSFPRRRELVAPRTPMHSASCSRARCSSPLESRAMNINLRIKGIKGTVPCCSLLGRTCSREAFQSPVPHDAARSRGSSG